jgi:hypothetical protein
MLEIQAKSNSTLQFALGWKSVREMIFILLSFFAKKIIVRKF